MLIQDMCQNDFGSTLCNISNWEQHKCQKIDEKNNFGCVHCKGALYNAETEKSRSECNDISNLINCVLKLTTPGTSDSMLRDSIYITNSGK